MTEIVIETASLDGDGDAVAGGDSVDPASIRYLIVSDGRTGSSLIASILGFAGADLGTVPVESWDPRMGTLEYPETFAATRTLERAQHLTELATRVPGLRPLARLYRSLAKRRVRRLMAGAPFVKCSAYAIPVVYKIGMVPRIIAVYRDFSDIARSKMLKQRTAWPELSNRLEATYWNALIGIHTFGGCAIAYEDMVDPEETAWIGALEACTGLAREAIARGRERLVTPARGTGARGFDFEQRLQTLEAELRALRGRYVPPSWQYLEQIGRLWPAKR